MNHPLKKLVISDSLIESLAKKYGTPLYLYDKNQLIQNIVSIDKSLKNNFRKYQIFYTIKANSNPSIIKLLKSSISNLGADCSSPGELYAAKLGGISGIDCIYTGNYESDMDLKLALEDSAHINLDDINSFHRLKKIEIPDQISFRLNPGFGNGAYDSITTGGHNSKFGIPKEKIVEAYLLAKENGVKSFGLQCMTGSGVLNPDYFPKLMNEILKIANSISNKLDIKFKYISIGGGFGIPYNDNESSLNFDKIFKEVGKVFHSNFFDDNIPELWIEPGRSVVGNAGILLSRVTGIKSSYKNYIGLDAGMETLMRPALYNAKHRIYKLGCLNPKEKKIYDFTGRICENTDRIAKDLKFPKVKEGDLVLIMDVGAYGFSMSHQFCVRPKTAEVLLDKNTPMLIRSRETIEELFENCLMI
ncbi:MAG: diaminopimelate decarboxylase [Candidatus Neomarinimicrobiota bacterium]|tara:strand:+ start:8113 stop:9363 length:1251 start_codon:yes stop_codon:yes gene_type:complete